MNSLNLIRTVIFAASLLLQLNTFCLHSHAAAGDVDLSFDPGSGVNGPVNAVVVQPDGKIIIGGQFSTVRGLMRTNLARLNADGSGDPMFNPIPSYNPIHALALQSDGRLLVGTFLKFTICDEQDGCFDHYESSVVRLDSNGSLDGSFQPATAQNYSEFGQFRSLVAQPDGKVLIAGNFTSVNGTNRNGIARLNADGTLDTSFNIGSGPNGAVDFVAGQPDGKVLIGGRFTTFNGTNCGSLARLHADGTLDGSFNSGYGVRHYRDCGGDVCYDVAFPTAVALQPDGKLLAGVWIENWQCDPFDGGCFVSQSYAVARLNGDGSSDACFAFSNVVTNTALLGLVKCIAVQPDDKIVVASSAYNSVRIARLNADGSWDDSFDPGTGPNSGVNALAPQPDGKMLIGGNFTTVNGTNRNRIARLNTDGSLDGGFYPGRNLERPVSALALQPDGKALVGRPLVAGDPWLGLVGDVLAFVNGTNQHGRLRLHADGSLDSAFTSTPFDPPLTAFFHTEDCFPDPSFGCFYGVVAAAVLAQSDGKVLVGGHSVTTITGELFLYQVYRPLLARFTASGTLESSFDPVIGSELNALAQQPDGKILIGGYFSTTNGTHRNIARLNMDGSLDGSFNPGTGANARVASIALQSDGRVLIGGDFTAVNGTNRDGIARLNSDGSLDGGFNPAPGVNGSPNRVSAVAVQPDGKVLIGGDFTAINGTNRHHVARLQANGSLDTSFNPGTGTDARVRSIVLQPDGNVLIGGDFTSVNGVLRQYAARLHGDSPALPSLTITRSNELVTISWPVTALSFQLQEATNLALPNSWSPVVQPAQTNAGQVSVTISTSATRKFFRLTSE